MIFGRRASPKRGLHVCEACGADTVNPVRAEPLDDDYWDVTLRCGTCDGMRRTIITNEVAARYDLDLDFGWREIGRAVQRLERESMEEWAEAFIGALDRDLVDAGDFSERR